MLEKVKILANIWILIVLCAGPARTGCNAHAEAHFQMLRRERERLHWLCRVHGNLTLSFITIFFMKTFQLVFYIMSDGTAEEALTRIFRVFDVNGDGHITEKELKRLVKDMFKLVKDEAPEEVRVKRWLITDLICVLGDKTVSHRERVCWDGSRSEWKGRDQKAGD